MPPGMHRVQFRKSGFAAWFDSVEVSAGQDTVALVAVLDSVAQIPPPRPIDTTRAVVRQPVAEEGWRGDKKPYLGFNRAGDQIVSGHPADGLQIWDRSRKQHKRLTPIHHERDWQRVTGQTSRATGDVNNSLVLIADSIAVYSVSWSPDGSQVVSGGVDGTVRMWDVVTGEQVGAALRGHEADQNGNTFVYSVSWSPDGSQVVSGGFDGTVRLWDVATGEQVGAALRGHEASQNGNAWVYSVSWSPDGSQVVSGGLDGTVRMWDVVTGEQVGAALRGHEADQYGDARVYSVSWSPDGSQVVSGGFDGTVRMWDVVTGEQVGAALRGHEADQYGDARVLSVSWSPDGNQVVSGGADGTVRMWDVATGEQVGAALRGHEADQDGFADVWSVSWSPDGRQVVSGGRDGTVRMWDVATGEQVGAALRGHEAGQFGNARVRSVSWSPDGSQVVSGGADGTVRMWDVATGEQVGAALRGHEAGQFGNARVRSVSWSPDGSQVVSGGEDGTVRMWDVATGEQVGAALRGHEADQDGNAGVYSVSWSPDGSQVVSGVRDGTVRMWDVATGEQVGAALRGHEADQFGDAWVNSVSWSPDGNQVVSGGEDGTVRMWDLVTGEQVGAALRGHEAGQNGYAGVFSVSWSPDGRQVVSGGADGTVRIWHSIDGWHPASLHPPKTCEAPLPGTVYTYRPADEGLTRYDTRSNQPVDTLTTPGEPSCVTHLKRGYLSWAGADSSLHIWNYAGTDSVQHSTKLTHPITHLFAWKDGRHLVSSGPDSTLLIWHADSLTVKDTLVVPGKTVQGLSVNNDGSLMVASTDSALAVWDIRPTKRAMVTSWAFGDGLLPLLVLLLLALCLAGLAWYRRLRTHGYLVRGTSADEPDIANIYLKGLGTVLFPTLELYRVAQQMRLRNEVVSRDLDVVETVKETVHHGGMFTPVFSKRKVTPEYLILIDRSTAGDQQAAFIDNLLDQLESDELFTRYYFDRDPRICFPDNPVLKPRSLYTLARAYPGHRLLIFSEGYGFFNPVSGDVSEWVDQLDEWPNRFLFVSADEHQMNYRLPLLAERLLVLPASVQGLVDMRTYLQGEQVLPSPSDTNRAPFPALLHSRPLRWIEPDAPPRERVDAMLKEVEAYLGPNGYRLLAACAIYPQMLWKLTVNLAYFLKDEKGDTLLDTATLASLARLPWFRHNYMPDWLRLRLIKELTAREEQEIRVVLLSLLNKAVLDPHGRSDLSVAMEHPKSLQEVTNALLRQLRGRVESDHPLKDYVFLTFIRRQHHEKLAVRISRALTTLVTGDKALYRRDREDVRTIRRMMGLSLLGTTALIALALWGWQQIPTMYTTPRLVDVWVPPAQAEPQDRLTNSLDMEFVRIEPGSFMMGSENGYDDEQPVHEVTITQSFYMGITEVTQGQWQAVMGNNPSRHQNSLSNPVESVSWDDVQNFIRTLNTQDTQYQYRLPTEAEWEYACRAGSSTAYYYGDDPSELGTYAVFAANTHEQVGSKTPNVWGLYDMVGNVYEWTADYYGPYESEPVVDPAGPESGDVSSPSWRLVCR